MSKSGIYKITNLINGMIYIGQAINLNKRVKAHICSLNLGKHNNRYLQNAWNKYGQDNFKFEAIEYCDLEILTEREQFNLDASRCYDRTIGYNIYNKAKSPRGYVTSEITKLKLSNAIKGTKRSGETRAKMSAWQVGRKMSDEAKINMTKAKMGKQYNRQLNRWPCQDGCKCKCTECKRKRKLQRSIYDFTYNERLANGEI